jgi:hypothetical protein
MIGSPGKTPIIDTSESSAFMYKVTMVVQVIAPNKELADMKLDQDGGYVSKRDVEFVSSVLLYKDDKEDKKVSKVVEEKVEEDEDYV